MSKETIGRKQKVNKQNQKANQIVKGKKRILGRVVQCAGNKHRRSKQERKEK